MHEYRVMRTTACRECATARHGYARSGKTAEYRAWEQMGARCASTDAHKRKSYPDRGIVVCPEWRTFEVFLSHVGPRPSPEHSLDRINNDGNYEPGNVRWATRKEQARNKSSSRFVEAYGVKKTLAEWAEISGHDQSLIAYRLRRGMRPEDALFTAAHQCGGLMDPIQEMPAPKAPRKGRAA